jgi:hypothetical protein
VVNAQHALFVECTHGWGRIDKTRIFPRIFLIAVISRSEDPYARFEGMIGGYGARPHGATA